MNINFFIHNAAGWEKTWWKLKASRYHRSISSWRSTDVRRRMIKWLLWSTRGAKILCIQKIETRVCSMKWFVRRPEDTGLCFRLYNGKDNQDQMLKHRPMNTTCWNESPKKLNEKHTIMRHSTSRKTDESLLAVEWPMTSALTALKLTIND